MTTQLVDLVEYAASGSDLQVDAEKGVIRNVKIIGHVSANGRRYAPEALTKAIGMYEGRQVNVNHASRPGESRSAYDRFGWLESVKSRPDGLYGDLQYLKTHSQAAPTVEAAQRNPRLFGLSHNARGVERRANGETVIESIESVLSVDLVADPATVAGLHESRNPMKTTWKTLIEQHKATPQGVALREMADAAGMGDAEAPAASTPDDAIKGGFKAAIHAVVDDDKLDMQAKLAKIKDILKAQDKLMGGGKAEEKPAEKPAEESRQQQPASDDVKQLREEMAVRDLVEEAGLKFAKPTARKAFVKSLVPLSAEERTALIEEQKTQAPPAESGRSGVKSQGQGGPLQEQKDAKPADSREAFAKTCFVK